MNNYKNIFEKDTEMFNRISKMKVTCKCSHTIALMSKDRVICSHCGNWVYKTPELEFKYKMMEKMKKMERNDKDEYTV